MKSTQQNESGELPSLCVKTFGCQMNEYDSQKIVTLLRESYQPTDSVENAKVIIVNSCSVRDKAEHKLFSMLGELRELKEEKGDLVIGVAGCVAQQEGERILKRNSAVDFVVGTHNLSLIPSLIREAKLGRKKQVAVSFREEWENLPPELDSESGEAPVRGLVAIQRGCSKTCTYCVVPGTRGPEVSRDPAEIEREVRVHCARGVKEILLLGQTVNSYGRDLNPRVRFDQLIRRVAALEGVKRIRFTSPHPAEVKPELIDLYGEEPKLCRHIHLPLQSGSDRILRLMKRTYRIQRYLEIVKELQSRYPDIGITTDIIAGFPTETEEDFNATLDVMCEVRYHSVYSFKYSRRPRTAALEHFTEDQEVKEETALRRLLSLQALQEKISEEINRERIGSAVEVLVESRQKQISSPARGRVAQNTILEFLPPYPEPGSMVMARVTDATAHGLRGKVVE